MPIDPLVKICKAIEDLAEKRGGHKEETLFEILIELVDAMNYPSPMLPRKKEEIAEAEEEFYDRVWYDRHMSYSHKDGSECLGSNEQLGCSAAAEKRKQYGEDNLGPYDKFQWGMVNGKLSALRWINGDEWDMLDT